jgi:glycosyltransferase involved in cell wall biosynthesis
MRVAYLTTYNAANVHNWSGLGYYIAKALERQNLALEYVGSLQTPCGLLYNAKKWLFLKILQKRFLVDRDPKILKAYARQVERSLAILKVDALFSPGTAPLALLETDKPTFFWTDSVFAGMIGFYPAFTNLAGESARNGCRMEAATLQRCRLAFYSSDWAANDAMTRYPQAKSKVRVVPFGANVEDRRSLEDIKAIVSNRPTDHCILLFNGVEWFRKGGDTALEIATRLQEQGLKVTLSIVGCQPPVKLPNFVTSYGFLSKSSPHGRRILDRLFTESHFLVVPSRAENFGVVFAEASSFGMPSITRDTGGVRSAVRNGLNGQVFAVDAPVSEYCAYISNLMQNRGQYRELALTSFNEYQTRLNWRVAGASIRKMMEEVI